MPVAFIMPKFDMDQEQATIASWLKKEGDEIKADEAVLVVETEKVAIEVPAPASGRLAAVRYHPGDVVPVTTVIAYILKDGETAADLPKAAAGPLPLREAPPASSSLPVTPVAARLAKEQGVDLSQVAAAGGRVSREDVERYLQAKAAAPSASIPPGRVAVAATPAARRLAREGGLDLALIAGSGPRSRVQAQDVTRSTRESAGTADLPSASGREAQVVGLTGMRQKIAERMTASFHDIPHISLTVEADVSAFETVRARLGGLAEREGGEKVSLTALLVKITAWALERNRALNASLSKDQIYQWQDVNIGVATALPGGLIVPVIHQAQRKSVGQIAAALSELTTRARENRLRVEDLQHSTFTISNLGMFGIRQFRAIINPPECAILAVGAIVRKPVVLGTTDQIIVRPILTLTLSADHRLIDGVQAARFLADLVLGIEQPEALLY